MILLSISIILMLFLIIKNNQKIKTLNKTINLMLESDKMLLKFCTVLKENEELRDKTFSIIFNEINKSATIDELNSVRIDTFEALNSLLKEIDPQVKLEEISKKQEDEKPN